MKTKPDMYKLLRQFSETNIKILADNQKTFMHHLETTENAIMALCRVLGVDMTRLAKEINNIEDNRKSNDELANIIKKENAVPAPEKSNRKKSK